MGDYKNYDQAADRLINAIKVQGDMWHGKRYSADEVLAIAVDTLKGRLGLVEVPEDGDAPKPVKRRRTKYE